MVSIWELSTVLRNLPQSWECMSLACHRLLGVSSYSIRIHIKVAIIHHFFALTFSYGWKQMTGKLHPVWQMTGWHRSTGCPLANCCYWRRGREQIDSRCSNYRACSSHRETAVNSIGGGWKNTGLCEGTQWWGSRVRWHIIPISHQH